jgi:hypothetical protein
MGKFIDLTGDVYGKLEVLKRVGSRGSKIYWLCKCECGNQKEVRGNDLRSDKTKSCNECPVNTWEFKSDYVMGYTTKGEEFLIDIEDYKEVSKYAWYMDGYGYIASSNVKGKTIKLHRFVMKAKKDEFVDHIHHKKIDNRKSELRICTKQQNNMNKKGVKGYTWNKKRAKYQAKINFKGKRIYLGFYATEEEARLAYCTKALELFGEFAHPSVGEDYERLSKKLKNNLKENIEK